MKKLTLLFVLLFSLGVYSQDSLDINSVDITEAERIVDKYSGKISDAFEKGLEKVTPVAEEGFKIAVKVQVARGIGEFIKAGVSLIVIFIVLFLQFKVHYWHVRDEHSAGDAACIAWIGGGLIQVGFLIYIVNCLYDGILLTYAPEWFAIKEIISMFN